MDRFWCCYVERTGGFDKRHATIDDAEEEAARLAQLPTSKGKKVYVLEVVSYCQVEYPPVIFHKV